MKSVTVEQLNAQLQAITKRVDNLENMLYTIDSERRVALLGQVDTIERAHDMPRTSDLRRRLKEAKTEVYALKQLYRQTKPERS